MNVNISWDNPQKTMIYWFLEEDWNWKDFHTGVNKIRKMLDTVNHDVYIVFNSHKVPSDAVRRFPGIVISPLFNHPHSGRILIVSGNFYTASLTKSFREFFNSKVELVDNIEKARALAAR